MGSRWRVTEAAALVVMGSLAVTVAVPTPAHAQGARHAQIDPQKKESARATYKQGEPRFKEGAYAAALEFYRAADAILPIAATKFKMAQCQDRLGQPAEAIKLYQLFLDSSPDPAKLGEAMVEAQQRIASLRQTGSRVIVVTQPQSPPRLMFSLDNGPAQALPTEVTMLPPDGSSGTAPAQPARVSILPSVPPGHHRVIALADGYDATLSEFDLGSGETRTIRVTLKPLSAHPLPGVAAVPGSLPPPAPGTAPMDPPPPQSSGFRWGYVVIGLGVGAVGVGTGLGVTALSAKSDFNSHPTTANADHASQMAMLSDVFLLAGLGVAGVGTYMLFAESPAPTQTGQAPNARRTGGVKGFVSPYVTPQGGGARAVVSF